MRSCENGATVLQDFLTCIELLRSSYYYGPYMVYTSTDWDKWLDDDYRANDDRTLRQRLLQIEALLWAHPEGMTRAEIARRLGVNRSTIGNSKGVVALLSRDFVKLVLIANLVAWPLAYFVMNKWMQNFAYRAGITLWIFLLTGLVARGSARRTVSFQSIRAALSDPVRAIKHE